MDQHVRLGPDSRKTSVGVGSRTRLCAGCTPAVAEREAISSALHTPAGLHCWEPDCWAA